jgi:N-acylneuraminate cytidylyltransferase
MALNFDLSSCFALIPARAGSKRIPGKNLRDFCGKPIIAWSIEAAKASGLFGSIVVSTDSPEIAELSLSLGAEVPFSRPPELSNDHAGVRDVVSHAIEYFNSHGRPPAYVCCLLATAPFLLPDDLKRGLECLIAQESDFAYSVTKYPHPIQRALRKREDGRLEMFQPEFRRARSQDMEEAYHDAAQFYWGKAASFLDRSRWIPSPASVPIILPSHRVQDVDTLEDWARAELMFRALQSTGQ